LVGAQTLSESLCTLQTSSEFGWTLQTSSELWGVQTLSEFADFE